MTVKGASHISFYRSAISHHCKLSLQGVMPFISSRNITNKSMHYLKVLNKITQFHTVQFQSGCTSVLN